jgi:hypothetical protein
MRHLGLCVLVAFLGPVACGGGTTGAGKTVTPDDVTGGAGGSAGAGGAPTSAGGSSGTGGSGGAGGAVSVDAAAADSGGGGPAGEGGTGGDDASADTSSADAVTAGGEGMLGFYEAEAVMPAGPNELIAPAIVNNCPNMSPACGAPDTIKSESMCCSAGKEVRQLLRGRGGLQFNKIAAPADGMYDVTWYYHCGKNDNFGDGNCGGEPNHPAGGCRPHVLTINGTRQPKVYEFHCYPGPWGEIHVVTTPQLPLKMGDNSIRVVATPGRDAADLDAIAVFPAGKGAGLTAFAH